jgi:hypothetical protein
LVKVELADMRHGATGDGLIGVDSCVDMGCH